MWLVSGAFPGSLLFIFCSRSGDDAMGHGDMRSPCESCPHSPGLSARMPLLGLAETENAGSRKHFQMTSYWRIC